MPAFANRLACASAMAAAAGASEKASSRVRLEVGEIVLAEVHWYEATGIGKREFKIKRIL